MTSCQLIEWEAFKTLIRSTFIHYTIGIGHTLHVEIKQVEDSLLELERVLIINPDRIQELRGAGTTHAIPLKSFRC